MEANNNSNPKTKMQLPPPGNYIAKLNGQIIPTESKEGAWYVAIPAIFTQGEHANFTTLVRVTIIKKDGSVMDAMRDNLMAAFGWNGIDPFWLYENSAAEKNTLGEIEFALNQCSHEEYEGRMQFRVGFLNPLGSAGQMPELGDRAKFAKKFGSKLRALSGGTPPKPPATKTKGAPKPAAGPVSTMEEAWDVLQKANPGVEQDKLEKIWFNAQFELTGKRDNSATPQQWGQLTEQFSDNVKM